jgi:uncharacterized membrane protein YjfL (UPF0719 family)
MLPNPSSLYRVLNSVRTFAVSLWLLLKVFTWLTPVDEWEELRKGNLGIAIIMAAIIIGFVVVGSMVAPPPVVPVAP